MESNNTRQTQNKIESAMVPETPSLIQGDIRIPFTFQGRSYSGYKGDTIASALYRSGVRIFSRSFKYHRPRGLMILDGSSPNDLVQVNNTPNVHASTTPLEPGMEVEGQNAWPSLNLDMMRVFDFFSPLLPVGFYYKLFIRPRAMWPVYEKVLRNAAGLGKINPEPAFPHGVGFDKTHAHADLTVIGGGPAGLSAALAAAGQGIPVTLVEQNPWLGGHLRYQTWAVEKPIQKVVSHDLKEDLQAFQWAVSVAEQVRWHENIRVLDHTTAFGSYADNLFGLVRNQELIKLRSRETILATGRIPQPLVFEKNDLPGIFLGEGSQRLMNLYEVQPGQRAVVITDRDQGWEVARDLLDHDVKLISMVDIRHEMPASDLVQDLRERGIPNRSGWTIRRAVGRRRVQGVVIQEQNRPVRGEPNTLHLACDTIIICAGYAANNALLYQSGAEIQYDPQRDEFLPQTYPAGVRGAGHAAGKQTLEAVLLDGTIRGLEAAARLGQDHAGEDLDGLRNRLQELTKSAASSNLSPALPGEGSKKFVCFCEDVTHKDVIDAVSEGFDDIQTLKRYSTISMGPTQGKICSVNAIKILAQETDRTIAETGTTTSRPPFTPVKLGVLAGSKLEPIQRTPMHHLHLKHGARMMNAGRWKRSEEYGNIRDEVLAVRNRVGMIDVSTLGKLDLQGPDALPMINRLYTNDFRDLDQNQLRYGMMCTEEGIILDDGIVGKVSEDHYILTTTSGGAQRIYEWVKWWSTVWDFNVHITDRTSSFAALNLAGPQARNTLAAVTDLDLSSRAFPYMHMRQAKVAGIPARMMRIGFVGELGYEIHYPAYDGPRLWEILEEAGARHNLSPFGIEAQRILRLEKQHIIIGQDTNALSNPYGANMGWVVDLEKDDFIGKPSMVQQKDTTQGEQLVGFLMADTAVVPGEGDQMVDRDAAAQQGHPLVGRVTSARFSPTLQESIGMGWVRADYAPHGTQIQIRVDGKLHTARVVRKPFYDPRGDRVRM